jgi:hypothetical protein
MRRRATLLILRCVPETDQRRAIDASANDSDPSDVRVRIGDDEHRSDGRPRRIETSAKVKAIVGDELSARIWPTNFSSY